jgi:hypothetical protein
MADTPPNPPAPPAPPAAPPAPPAPPPGVTQEQLHQAIEKARLEEREKLRTQLDNAKSEAETAKTQAEDNKKQLQKLSEEMTALKSGLKPEGGIDVQKAIEQAVTAATTRLAQTYDGQLNTLKSELQNERVERTRLSAEQLRVRMIEQAGGTTVMIPELVRGTTQDEITSSIEDSKRVFQRTVALASGTPPPPPNTANTNVPGAAVVPPTVPVGAGGAGTPPAGGAPAKNARTLTRQEYAQQREQLKKQAAARYPTSVLTQ